MLGVSRSLFSGDYPHRRAPDAAPRRFLVEADLAANKAAIAHGNWERLVSGIRH